MSQDTHPPPPSESHAFLLGCGLPGAWRGAAQWRILETDFALGGTFLETWAAWRSDAQRPRMLHYVALMAQPPDKEEWVHAARQQAHRLPLAELLAAQAWGLLPGIHRLSFENGQLLLTLCIGDVQRLLRKERWQVDAVVASCSAQLQALDGPKALARSCERGTRLVARAQVAADVHLRRALEQAGFAIAPTFPEAGHAAPLHAAYQPQWEPRKRATSSRSVLVSQPMRCAVIGAGLAGACVAASLARRGWQVDVLDAASESAAGASGLPVGLFAPHLSPDDNVYSKVSRAGVRATLEQCAGLLDHKTDWRASGVLERRPEQNLGLPANWGASAGVEWSESADAVLLRKAGLPADGTACWHHRAGWIRPARLVAALLACPGIRVRTHSHVAHLHRVDADGKRAWQLQDAQASVLLEAELVVLATGPACNALIALLGLPPLPLDSVRGQLSWGVQSADMDLPAFPINGSGALIGHVPMADGRLAWHAGSTFERGQTTLPLSPAQQRAAHDSNFAHLQQLLPNAAPQLSAQLAADAPELQAWASVRCTSPDRLPIVGPVDAQRAPGVWVSTAMGARGLTRAVLCGELMAARLHAEPLPIEERLARAMGTERLAASAREP